METAPIEIVSPPVAVRRGQLIRIHGWVRVPRPITASPDGLQVFDSFGGPALAERIRTTDGWREFVLYRAAPRDGQLLGDLRLDRFGRAWLERYDTLALHGPIAEDADRHRPDQARRLPPVTDRARARRPCTIQEKSSQHTPRL